MNDCDLVSDFDRPIRVKAVFDRGKPRLFSMARYINGRRRTIVRFVVDGEIYAPIGATDFDADIELD